MLDGVVLMKRMDDEIFDLTNLMNEKLWMLPKYLHATCIQPVILTC